MKDGTPALTPESKSAFEERLAEECSGGTG
jgi:hypothetical protein